MAALPLPARGDRRTGALRTHDPDPAEPERTHIPSAALSQGAGPYNREHPHMAIMGLSVKKRACKWLETIPNEAETRLLGYAMEMDSKQKISSDCDLWATKAKQNSMVFENHGSRGTAQPCPRCIAGESGHFNHILSF